MTRALPAVTMSDLSMPEYKVSLDQLKPGVFIRLERVNWFNHPFLFSSFKIRSQEEIEVLRSLGVTEAICVPEKSDCLPGPAEPGRPAPAAPSADKAGQDLWRIKKERIERLRRKKALIAECEERYAASLKDLTRILQGLSRGNSQSVLEALAFVERLRDNFLSDAESTLHLMNVLPQSERVYSHALNVAVLSMMVGRDAGLNAQAMVELGMGALFHDIGETRIEKRVLRKRGNFTRPERELIEKHPQYGQEMLEAIAEFPRGSLPVVLQHHERWDGSGYPAGLAGEDIALAARIVAIADAYDNHCNHPDPEESFTPYLALSFMFTQQKKLFDKDLLALFIRCLGVYPPGTVVQLSNGAIGMVMAVNPDNQLCPSLVLYDPQIPKKEALIIDLADEPDLKVEKSIRLKHLPQEIFDYLSPRTRITYFVEPDGNVR
jgi:HD-GYP domain-containing protein (c-di-GMP phosphodiesterase class II)